VTNGQPQYRTGNFQPEKRAKANRFGFFGQFVDNKGVWLLLEAVQELRQDGFTDFVLELNGDNLKYASQKRRQEFQDFMKEEEERPRMERNVFLNGSYAPDQLAQRMARVDWCVVPSVWWEIFGLVISEAWMFGRPVIASNVGGPRERITHGTDGLLFEVANSSSLAQTIRRAASEEGLWERLSGGITPPATLETMTNGFLDLYRAGNRPLTATQSPRSA
jgi:glycosyltransferase involved in cell wall biosynthesis